MNTILSLQDQPASSNNEEASELLEQQFTFSTFSAIWPAC